ncbi:MAG: endonuclease/exonuclease/phosphatase family protein [Bacteroidota bacterium]|nr:endonuclease/exonuclease/phosphatase family protein [Bacteroidota bacterium]
MAFYNLENLFDTINDVTKDDEEFLPGSPRKYNTQIYIDKLDKLSSVLEKLGDEDGPEIIGVSEVENKSVLEDLINTGKLKQRRYSVAIVEGPDKRGVDVGLIYKKQYFKPISIKGIDLKDTIDPEFKTRNQLVVTGILSNDTITFIINHWPSRRGGGKDDKRILAAKRARQTVDSLFQQNKNAKILVMGDFNDDPNDKSIYDYLNAKPEKKLDKDSLALFNPMYNIHKNGYGSLSYNKTWNLFDQIIISQSIISNKNTKYYYLKNSAAIYYKKWLLNSEGKDEGAPKRTWQGNTYIGGYSDHLPVFLYLVQKVVK